MCAVRDEARAWGWAGGRKVCTVASMFLSIILVLDHHDKAKSEWATRLARVPEALYPADASEAKTHVYARVLEDFVLLLLLLLLGAGLRAPELGRSSDGAMGAIGMGGGHVTLSHSRFVSVVWACVAIGFPVLSTDRFFTTVG